MVCSSCGQERPEGDRFCGICGTPLPHRPLSAAGAEATINLSRGPLEISAPHSRSSTAVAGLLEVLAYNGTSRTSAGRRDETPAPESIALQTVDEAAAVLAEPEHASQETTDEPPKISVEPGPTCARVLQNPGTSDVDIAKPPRVSPLEETATPDPTAVSPPDVSHFLDELAASPDEPSKSTEAPHFPWMDDVLHQIEREESKTSAAGDEKPRFLDFLGDLSQPEAPHKATALSAADLPEASKAPAAVSRPRIALPPPPSSRWRLWLTAAAVLIFVTLAGIQWRHQIARSSERLQDLIDDKVDELATRNEAGQNKGAASSSADPLDTNNLPAQSQPSPNPPPEMAPATANAPSASSAVSTSAKENLGTTTATDVTGKAPKTQVVPTAQNEPETPRLTGPGAREMMRAEQARTAAARSEWLWKATAKGNPDAPLQLADLYVAGEGVPRSCEQAMVLLKTAALANNARACDRLASMYANGTCVPRSQLEAYRWLSTELAVNPNDQKARHQREAIWQQMTPDEQTLAQESH